MGCMVKKEEEKDRIEPRVRVGTNIFYRPVALIEGQIGKLQNYPINIHYIKIVHTHNDK